MVSRATAWLAVPGPILLLHPPQSLFLLIYPGLLSNGTTETCVQTYLTVFNSVLLFLPPGVPLFTPCLLKSWRDLRIRSDAVPFESPSAHSIRLHLFSWSPEHTLCLLSGVYRILPYFIIICCFLKILSL